MITNLQKSRLIETLVAKQRAFGLQPILFLVILYSYYIIGPLMKIEILCPGLATVPADLQRSVTVKQEMSAACRHQELLQRERNAEGRKDTAICSFCLRVRHVAMLSALYAIPIHVNMGMFGDAPCIPATLLMQIPAKSGSRTTGSAALIV